MKYLITFFLLFFIPFAEATTAPNWVLGKGHPKYNTNEYIIGIGHSDKSTVSAGESARADLIKNIRVRIRSILKDYTSTDKSFAESSIVSESEFLLEGSELKDGWHDEEKDIFYSLAVIKRSNVADTLMEMIGTLVSKNDLTLRQADTFFNDGNILKALIYYYDGYIESSKIGPYIQTYNSVVIGSNKMALGKDYSLLFKEKIQNIVDNIVLKPLTKEIKSDVVQFKVVVLFNNRPIAFPVKFHSVYKHFVDRTLCKTEGCVLNVSILEIINNNYAFYIMSGIDTRTLKKYFTYDLEARLFKRLELLKVGFKKQLEQVNPNTIDLDIERDLSRKDRVFRRMDKEVQRRNRTYQKPNIDLSPLESYESQARRQADEMRDNSQNETLKPPSFNQTHIKKLKTLNNCNKCNLSGAILSREKLKGADMSESNLSHTNLSHADLSDSNLTGSNLSNANIRSANLSSANLSKADFSHTNLENSNLIYARLNGSNLDGARLVKANISYANLVNSSFKNSILTEANFIGANLSGANLSHASLNGANLKRVRMSQFKLKVNLTGADLTGAALPRSMKDINLIGANLTQANLVKVDFSGADLTRANLTGANLTDAKLDKATLCNTITPWGLDNSGC